AGCWSRAPCGPHAAVAANVLPASNGARALRVTPSLFICGPHFPFCRGNDDISYWAREACKHAMRKGQSRQAIESRAYEADFRHNQAKGRRDGAGPFFAPAVPDAVLPAGFQLPVLYRTDSHSHSRYHRSGDFGDCLFTREGFVERGEAGQTQSPSDQQRYELPAMPDGAACGILPHAGPACSSFAGHTGRKRSRTHCRFASRRRAIACMAKPRTTATLELLPEPE